MLTTLISVAIFVVGSVFDGDSRFGYDAMLTPLRYAGLCVLPTFATWSRRELRPGELVARMVLEWALIEGVMLALAFSSPVIDTSRPAVVLTLGGSVLAIYALARCLSWLRDTMVARSLSADLRRFQQFHGE